MFELSESEYNLLKDSLTSQIVISNGVSQTMIYGDRLVRRYMPFAFTEIGVAMLSSILRSDTAVLVNRSIMRAFVAMRNYITTTSAITAELSEIRTKLELLERNDEETMEAVNDLSEDVRKEIDNIYQAIAALSVKVPKLNKSRKPIGYKPQ